MDRVSQQPSLVVMARHGLGDRPNEHHRVDSAPHRYAGVRHPVSDGGSAIQMKMDITDLPSDVQAQIRALEVLPDDQIDTTDAAEILEWSDARRGVFYWPAKQQITLRLDADIIAWFKAHAPDGRGYQTDINGTLRKHVRRTARSS